MFSDCVDRDRVIDTEGKVTWPGGDDPEEDELYDVRNKFLYNLYSSFLFL